MLNRLSTAAVWFAALAAPSAAQVVPVTNTGCPGAGFPLYSGSAQLGQQWSFRWPCEMGEIAFAIFGLPSGGGLALNQPLTCVAGPCVVYPALRAGSYLFLPPQIGRASWTLAIPNQPSLITTTFAVQVGCVAAARSCLTLGGALTLAIEP